MQNIISSNIAEFILFERYLNIFDSLILTEEKEVWNDFFKKLFDSRRLSTRDDLRSIISLRWVIAHWSVSLSSRAMNACDSQSLTSTFLDVLINHNLDSFIALEATLTQLQALKYTSKLILSQKIKQLTQNNDYLRQKIAYHQKMHEVSLCLVRKTQKIVKKLQWAIFDYRNMQREIDIDFCKLVSTWEWNEEYVKLWRKTLCQIVIQTWNEFIITWKAFEWFSLEEKSICSLKRAIIWLSVDC